MVVVLACLNPAHLLYVKHVGRVFSSFLSLPPGGMLWVNLYWYFSLVQAWSGHVKPCCLCGEPLLPPLPSVIVLTGVESHTDTTMHRRAYIYNCININAGEGFPDKQRLEWFSIHQIYLINLNTSEIQDFVRNCLSMLLLQKYEAEWVRSMLAISPREPAHRKVETRPLKGYAID